MGAEAIAALLVGAALLWVVVQPLVLPAGASDEDVDFPDPEETPRGQALLALKEIEFDRATGKLSDDDYAMLHAKYSAAAIAVLESPPAPLSADSSRSDRIEALVAARAVTPEASGGGFCSRCGAVLLTDAAYCARCGAPAIR